MHSRNSRDVSSDKNNIHKEEKFGLSCYAESGINSAPFYDAFFSLRLIAQKCERCITYETDAPKANNIRTFL